MLAYQTAVKKISEQQLASVYLLFGDEKYLQEELIELLSTAFFGSASSFGREKIDGAALSLDKIIEKLDTPNLFASKKLLIVENLPCLLPPRTKKEQTVDEQKAESRTESTIDQPRLELLEEFIDKQQSSQMLNQIIVFTAAQVDRRKKIFKVIDQHGVVVECTQLKGEALSRWIKNRAGLLGKKIEQDALERLLLSDNHSMHYLSLELDKYSNYLGADETIIKADVVDLLFSGNLQGNVFKLSDSLAEGKPEKAFELLSLLLSRREKPLLIFFMLVRHYRLLLSTCCLISEGVSVTDLMAALAVPHFVAKKLQQQSALYSQKKLEDIMISMKNTDMQIKTGQIEPTQALELMISRIDYIQRAEYGVLHLG